MLCLKLSYEVTGAFTTPLKEGALCASFSRSAVT